MAAAQISRSATLRVAGDAQGAPPAWLTAGGAPLLDPTYYVMQDALTPATKRQYRTGLRHFFGGDYTPEQARAFLSQEAREVAVSLSVYRASMRAAGTPAATINARLAAVRALVNAGKKHGFCAFDSRSLIKSEKVEGYRDTRGTDLANIKRLLAAPDVATLKGKRDVAILRLMFTTSLRRAGICSMDVSHFDPGERRIEVVVKGKTDRVFKTIPPQTIAAVQAYLAAAGHADGPLLRNCHRDPSVAGQGLTPRGLYEVIAFYGRKIGLNTLSPHKIRHSAITIFLDNSDGNILEAQGLSGHADIRTLRRYDDNRKDRGGKASKLLEDLLDG